MDVDAMVVQLDDVIQQYITAANTTPRPNMEWPATRLLAAITRLAPPGSDYVIGARRVTESRAQARPGAAGAALLGIAQALRDDLRADYVQSFAEIVHADVFSDFIGMAEELQENGYKDAAAVVVGSVLEDHLRKLAAKAGLAVERDDGRPMKADAINSDLTRAEVYNKLEQKRVTAWLDLRNKAAHGHYDEYNQEHVSALIRDIRGFLIALPA
jgi:hypothetical protein